MPPPAWPFRRPNMPDFQWPSFPVWPDGNRPYKGPPIPDVHFPSGRVYKGPPIPNTLAQLQAKIRQWWEHRNAS